MAKDSAVSARSLAPNDGLLVVSAIYYNGVVLVIPTGQVPGWSFYPPSASERDSAASASNAVQQTALRHDAEYSPHEQAEHGTSLTG